MAVVKQTTGWSYPSVAEFFGRHHTTVMGAVDKVAADPELSEAVRRVVAEMALPPQLFSVPATDGQSTTNTQGCSPGAPQAERKTMGVVTYQRNS